MHTYLETLTIIFLEIIEGVEQLYSLQKVGIETFHCLFHNHICKTNCFIIFRDRRLISYTRTNTISFTRVNLNEQNMKEMK